MKRKQTCTHHWMLGDSSGGIVPGACKKCGAERTFEATVVEFNSRVSGNGGPFKMLKRPPKEEMMMADEVVE